MRLIIFILLSIILSSNVEALAVASDYLENNTLILTEGTSTIYSIRLQNPNSYETKVKVDYDTRFMKTIDFKEEYTLPPESSTRIEFEVTAPEYNESNSLFVLGYTVHQLSGGGGGGVPFLTKINKNFKLEVVEDLDKFHINYAIVAIIMVLSVIIFFLLRFASKNLNRKIIK